MTDQLRPDGTLRHLVTLETLSRAQLEHLLERSQSFVRPLGVKPALSQTLAGATVANLFTEPSTRTRVSFELAAKRLGAHVVNLEVQLSSRVKGESMLDTVYTLQSLHVDAFVIRDAEAGVPGLVAAHVAPHVSVLSAGEAHVSHPTQGLLDALTIYQRKQRFAGLGIAIVGDIRHSRVARSAWHALRTLGSGEEGSLPREALVSKLYWSNWHRNLGELAMDVLGAEGALSNERTARLQRLFLFSRADTIYAGTNEIQRTIIGERALGLPPEPRVARKA